MTARGSRLSFGQSHHQNKIRSYPAATKATNGPDRGQLFYLGLAASLREGLASYFYMIPLGGAYDSENIPLPAVLGEHIQRTRNTHFVQRTYSAYSTVHMGCRVCGTR